MVEELGPLLSGQSREARTEARDQEPMSTLQTRGLSCKQWALLGEVVKRCPLSLCTIERIADLRRLCEAGLVTVDRTRVCATRLGMEMLWYHSLH